ncbi:hypothetical protein MSPP1_004167 [Malassezia sp. CBS 17886]|nr:hypothetical protein MSPP1_004167 [Malassezia sp. CBS 17886]
MELQTVLEEYADALYANAPAHGTHDEDDMDALRNGPPPVRARPAADDGIEAQMRRELAELQKSTSSRIVPLETDTECLCYLQCAPPLDATRLVQCVMEHVERTGETRSRFVQRLTPVDRLCHADVASIRTAVSAAVEPFFPAGRARTVRMPPLCAHPQYRVEPRIRSHSTLSRDALIPLVAACVPTTAEHRVDLSKPDVVIVVEILKNVCGVGAVEHFDRFAKMNVQTLADRWERGGGGEGAAAAGQPGGGGGDVERGGVGRKVD